MREIPGSSYPQILPVFPQLSTVSHYTYTLSHRNPEVNTGKTNTLSTAIPASKTATIFHRKNKTARS